MSSSDWRLIRSGSPVREPASAPAADQSAQATAQASTVLRGRSRSGGRSAHAATSLDLWAADASDVLVDQAREIAAEEMREIELVAEQRGYAAGRQRAEQEMRSSVEAAGALAERLASVAPERTAEVAHAVTELALAVARRILGHEVTLDPALLCAALEAAVGTINGSPRAHVLLNPAAVAPVKAAWESRHGLAFLGKKWIFEGDPTLPPGGCTLRHDHGFVEAGLESQLEEIGIALDRAIPGIARSSTEEALS
jgi:flagellar biosynthesis/type III secretory pathway protein FliH